MAQKRKINWKQVRATSMRHAMELCIHHGRDKHNRSVEQIAELMGESSHFTLYKWLESGRMPAIQIRPFEFACGINFVTRYLAHSDDHLLIKMPHGRKAENKELNDLGVAAHSAIAEIIKFYDGKAGEEETITAITALLEDLAYHRANVENYRQPELLGGDQ